MASSLLLCLFTGPRSEGVHSVAQLARAALRNGHQVGVFLGGDGTAHAQALAGLREAGARVVSCSADAAARGWDQPGTPGRGSFVDMGNLAADADAMLSLGVAASLDGRVVVRHGPADERGHLAIRTATALTLTGRSVRVVLDGAGAGWAVPVDVSGWLDADPGADLDGLVRDAGAQVYVGASTLATLGLEAGAVRDGVQVVDDAWRASTQSPPPLQTLHVVTEQLTDALVVHAIAADAREGAQVSILGMHDGVYETGVLARSLGEEGMAHARVSADDCRRRGLVPPEGRADEHPAMVEKLLSTPSTLTW